MTLTAKYWREERSRTSTTVPKEPSPRRRIVSHAGRISAGEEDQLERNLGEVSPFRGVDGSGLALRVVDVLVLTQPPMAHGGALKDARGTLIRRQIDYCVTVR